MAKSKTEETNSKRSGQVINRGNRTWYVRIFTGRDGAGKRTYRNKTIKGTKKDAEGYLAKTSTAISAGTFVEHKPITLDKYLDQWLESKQPCLSERTFADYGEVLTRYARPSLGGKRISALTPLDLQNVYSGMQAKGLSARTVRSVHVVLSSALKQAVRWRMIQSNPASDVTLPKITRREMKTLSLDEVSTFLKSAKLDAHGFIFAFGLATGMRPEEYLALQWKDVDLKKGTATVQRALCWRRQKGGGWYFSKPKTPQSRRTMPLPATTLRELTHHKAHQAEARLQLGSEYQNLDLIFATAIGGPLHQENLATRNCRRICKRAGLPASITPYTLRHTCATLLLLAGENPKVVSERLGHSSIAITLDIYSHVLPSMQQAATEKLEKMLYG